VTSEDLLLELHDSQEQAEPVVLPVACWVQFQVPKVVSYLVPALQEDGLVVVANIPEWVVVYLVLAVLVIQRISLPLLDNDNSLYQHFL